MSGKNGETTRTGRLWRAAAVPVALFVLVPIAAGIGLFHDHPHRQSQGSRAVADCAETLASAAELAARSGSPAWRSAHRACLEEVLEAVRRDEERYTTLAAAVTELADVDERVFARVAAHDLAGARAITGTPPRTTLRRALDERLALLGAAPVAHDGVHVALGVLVAVATALSSLVGVAWYRRGRRLARLERAQGEVAAVRAADAQAAGERLEGFQKKLRDKARELVLANAALAQKQMEMNDVLAKRVSSEAMNQAIVENAAEGIVAIESDGRVAAINAALCALCDVRAEELIGQPLTRLFPDCSGALDELTGEAREISAVRRDGAWVPVALRLTRTRLAHQMIYVGLVRDLTPARSAQAALDELNARLIDASRAAGRADVAASVLHNIGNVLNSINVSTSLLRDAVRASEAPSVGKIAALLASQPDLAAFFRDDPRAARVPEFLSAVAERLDSENAAFGVNLDELFRQVDHIKAVIGMQEAHAGLSSVTELLPVHSLVDDALAINRAGLAKTSVTIQREYEELPPMLVDRHRVLQILVNLLRNAQHAVAELPGERRVTVRVARRGASVALQVCDNGIGIAAENLPKLFQQGYTTKSFGHGYGMHSSAIAARHMGGALSAASDGTGHGATMTLELPIKLQEEVQRAA